MSYDNYHNGSVSVPNQSQWRIKAESLLADCDIWTPHDDKRFPLGAIAESRDGRKWRYQRCDDTTAITLATINQSAVETANWVDEPQTVASGAVAAAIGDKSITLLVQTAPTADVWVDGYLWVENGTGKGHMYVIKEHTLTTTPVVQIADAGGFRLATADATDISILANPYARVVTFPTNPTGICTGVAHVAVAVDQYFWGQVHGPCAVFNGTDDLVTGDQVCAGGQAAGVCSLEDGAAPNEGDVTIGYAMRATTQDNEVALVFLTIE